MITGNADNQISEGSFTSYLAHRSCNAVANEDYVTRRFSVPRSRASKACTMESCSGSKKVATGTLPGARAPKDGRSPTSYVVINRPARGNPFGGHIHDPRAFAHALSFHAISLSRKADRKPSFFPDFLLVVIFRCSISQSSNALISAAAWLVGSRSVTPCAAVTARA